jgi:hypothetical protein
LLPLLLLLLLLLVLLRGSGGGAPRWHAKTARTATMAMMHTSDLCSGGIFASNDNSASASYLGKRKASERESP